MTPRIMARLIYSFFLFFPGLAFASAPHSRQILEQNRAIAQACSAEVPVGTEVSVNTWMRELCRNRPNGNDVYYGSRVHYRIGRTENGVSLSMRVRLLITGDRISTKRAEAMLARARACVPIVRSIWSRYGIDFDLGIDSDRQATYREEDLDQVMRYVDDSGRANSGKLFAKGTGHRGGDGILFYLFHGKRARLRDFCSTLTHELGHHLSLDDEYYDSRCPDRPMVSREREPVSFMAGTHIAPLEELGFYPRHIASVVKPLCPLLMSRLTIANTNPPPRRGD